MHLPMKCWSLTFLHDFLLPIYCFLKREATYVGHNLREFYVYYKER